MQRSKSIFVAIPVLTFCLLVCTSTRGQDDLVKNEGITSSLHQANVGRIVFTSKPVPIESLKPTDFITTVELQEKADLSLRVFMGNSLTNYLHKLQPGLAVDELNRQGSFQFSFLVDGRLVHQENLNPYWVRAETKIKQTTLGLALLNSTEPDSAAVGARLWGLFLMNDGQKALSSGTHRLKIELRPYFKASEIKFGDLIAAGEIQVTIPPKRGVDAAAAIQPIQPNREWQISKAAYDRGKIEELNRQIAEKTYKEIKALVVIRDGQLLIEEYFNGATRDTLHDTRSVGKSFASTMLGIAIDEGHIKSENQTLKDFYDLKRFANYSPGKENVSLKHLLTMSSDFDGNDDNEDSPGNEQKMYPTADWVKFALDLPMDQTRTAGDRWGYFTAGVVVLGDIINKSVPEGLEKYADKKLFKPLGIQKYEWPYTPQKVPNTAGGLRLRALDFAKYGQLYQNGGKWNGKQVISREWVQKTFTRQIPLSPGGEDAYGYLFWNTTFKIDGKRHEAFFATGNGGSKIFVFKDRPLVIVVTGTAYGKWYMHSQVFSMINKYVLPAVLH